MEENQFQWNPTQGKFIPKSKASVKDPFGVWEKFQEDPLNFPVDILKIPKKHLWWGAQKIIKSAFENRRTVVYSGNSLSKDWSGGIIALEWLIKYWGNSKVICVGPKFEQVKEIMFSEIGKQYRRLQQKFPVFRDDWLTSHKLTFGPDCYALGMTSKDLRGVVGKLSGFKSPNLLIIVTEAQAVEPSVYTQFIGLMTAPNNHILELGNPWVCFGDFYNHCTDPQYGYNVINLSGDNSPNVIAGKEVIPGVMSIEFRDDLRRQCGDLYEDDPEYQVRYHGQFPQQAQDAWIPLSKIKQAVNRKFRNDDELLVGGLDVARMGKDETVHCVLKGRTQIDQVPFKKVLGPETIGWALGLIKDYELKAMAIDLGFDPTVHDMINLSPLTAKTNVMAINFGAKAPSEKYKDLGAYMWAQLRKAFMDDDISIMDDPVLVAQLSSRRVERTPKGQIKLKQKKEQNALGGQASPDRADALALAWYARLGGTTWSDSISDAGAISDLARISELAESPDIHISTDISDVDSSPFSEEDDDDSFGEFRNDSSRLGF